MLQQGSVAKGPDCRLFLSLLKYQTKQGEKWLFKLDIGKDPATGQRRTTTGRGFTKKKDAEAAANELLASLRDNTYDNRKITFELVYQEWLQYNKDT
ncbi:Arm DNA-binding domain-containing protein [Domibacillus sp. A3M-37]|uniref:Arm DNA-binding domain-containing protein n=1 Tax=Domibacillus sp. A3M-37 TaxID=2962037 RepID=UPI0020B9005F|nr:Arm DNA-binding domain-containing protein [Domibacillus sp. A3M-37]MCP3764044.1 Arm DNA-binding domain-containing protein [Domibacillus sp. A3M-37]